MLCVSLKIENIILYQGNTWNDQEKALLSIHLAVGVGFYHHLILKLQSTYSLDLMGIIDFAFVKSDMIVPNVSVVLFHTKNFLAIKMIFIDCSLNLLVENQNLSPMK